MTIIILLVLTFRAGITNADHQFNGAFNKIVLQVCTDLT